MIYVSRETISPERKRLSSRLTKDEFTEVNFRQAGYYKCPVAGCYRVEAIPYAQVAVVDEKKRYCPGCGKESDAPAARRKHRGNVCSACLRKKQEKWDAKRDPSHRPKVFGGRPEALRREAQTNA
jgi:hypothetical protein